MPEPLLKNDRYCAPVWPDALEPINEGAWGKEPFAPWWDRHRDRLAHLHPQIAEQWIHRHWIHSPLSWLSLDDLTWREIMITGEEVLRRVQRVYAPEYHPAYDYDVFARRGGDDCHPTAKALDSGTWDYPLLVLATSTGIITGRKRLPKVEWALVEGHQWHRYLHALHARETPPAGPHRMFILAAPMVR